MRCTYSFWLTISVYFLKCVLNKTYLLLARCSELYLYLYSGQCISSMIERTVSCCWYYSIVGVPLHSGHLRGRKQTEPLTVRWCNMSLLIKDLSTPSPTSAQTCVFLVGATRLVGNSFKMLLPVVFFCLALRKLWTCPCVDWQILMTKLNNI